MAQFVGSLVLHTGYESTQFQSEYLRHRTIETDEDTIIITNEGADISKGVVSAGESGTVSVEAKDSSTSSTSQEVEVEGSDKPVEEEVRVKDKREE